MNFRYSEWRDEQNKSRLTFDDLMKLFSQLLLRSDGDVRQALQWLTRLDQKHRLFDDEPGRGLGDFIEWLKQQGYVEEVNRELRLTRHAGQRIRRDALEQVFSSLRKSRLGGQHAIPKSGEGIERLSETKRYRFGDAPGNIDFTNTISNAIRRAGLEQIRIVEDDLEVYETEHLATCATVLLIDISHSMVLYGEDRITPAKNVALALSELILTKYPKDSLHVVLFGDEAVEVKVEDIPFVSVGPFHTNTRAGLQLARAILRRKRGVNKQIFMITDGKPSAIFEYGRLYKNPYGLDRKIVNKTLDEAVLCRREKTTITTFMIADDPWLVDFVNKLTQANRGRAYFSSLNRLGEFVFVDYLRNRRRHVR
ncbi:MAG: VWA domain-containing protein [candidate division KSB1 bacterium]|nr:VWA domain-containing protein [candidate division KSB1 bacterium]MDZ7273863.1 VWA domain-containing protein [candidate division KSB1 bacterium]MDZ7286019.1 VWA domain-containing protein [candidate division KSB1 bacterium]MDZ7299051.1 VWA domain-containing protein [candidate division KSB1 bacterium]MDZ7308817.1 VWA domain-containing protein [candidate division KSB1 bacterium]